MAFSYKGRDVAEVAISDIQGFQALGSYLLRFVLRLGLKEQADGYPLVFLRDLTATVYIELPQLGTKIIGIARQQDSPKIIQTYRHSASSNELLVLYMTRDTVDGIEEMVSGRDMTFLLSVRALVEGLPSHDTDVASTECRFTIVQGQWLRILEEMGYGKYLTLKIPVPDKQKAPALGDALDSLAQAHQAFLKGEYRDSVGFCRDALEALSTALNDRDDQDKEFQQLFQNTRESDKDARLRTFRKAMKLFTHPAKHKDQASMSIEYARRDALMAIQTLAALLERFA